MWKFLSQKRSSKRDFYAHLKEESRNLLACKAAKDFRDFYVRLLAEVDSVTVG